MSAPFLALSAEGREMTRSTAEPQLQKVQPSTDQLALALKSLPSDTWSPNLAKNTYKSILQTGIADFLAPGQTSLAASSDNAWAYSSGCYAHTYKAYFFTGGGHADWRGSEVGRFDCPTLSWMRTDDSARLGQNIEDPTVRYQSSDQAGWRAWRNPAGRFAPISTHMYGGMVYLPTRKKIFVQGTATYNSGMGNPGCATWIDPETGYWDEAGASPQAGFFVQGMSVLVPLVHVTDAKFAPTGETLVDCVFRSAGLDGYLSDTHGKTAQKTIVFYGAAGNKNSHGCVVADPIHPGRLAYVQDSSQTKFAVSPRIDFKRNTGERTNIIYASEYGNAKPAGVGNGTFQRWIYMGEFLPGCTKIAVFVVGSGVYALDTKGWTWSGPHAPMPPKSDPGFNYGDDGLFKRVEYFSDYDCFGLFDQFGAQFLAMKRPAIFSA
jgi:hypothetical protein